MTINHIPYCYTSMPLSKFDNLEVLDSKHMMTTLLHLYRNGPMNKTSLYNRVCRNPNMPQKLVLLEDAGLIMQMGTDNRATLVVLTEKGEIIAKIIAELDKALKPSS